MHANLIQWDNLIFLPKDEKRGTLQVIPVLLFTDDPCTASHKPIMKPLYRNHTLCSPAFTHGKLTTM